MMQWNTKMAVVTGSGHQKLGLPGQDRTWIWKENGVTAIALADGAGSAQFSQEGAEAAVRAVTMLLCQCFDQLFQAERPIEMRRLVLREALGAVLDRAEELGVHHKELACTLLAVAVRGDDYLLFHLGDGVIACQTAGKVKVASSPWNGEFANTTAFVTSPDALFRARVMKGTQPALEGFVLMSDGCEMALYHRGRDRLAPMLGQLLQRNQLLGRRTAQELLEATLERVIATKTGDDCGLALMTRPGSEFGHWERLTQREQAAALGVTTQNRNRRRRQIRRYRRKYGQ